MSRPGDRLRTWAARVCAQATMDRLVDPIVADLQKEYAVARSRGEHWRARGIRLSGYTGFWVALSAHVGAHSADAARRWLTDDDSAFGRGLGYAALVTVAMTGVLVAIPFVNILQSRSFPAGASGRLLMYLVPQGLVVALPMGLACGAIASTGTRALTPRIRMKIVSLAIASSLVYVSLLGWIVPNANQAFRSVIYQGERQGPPSRGVNELTWPQLARRVRTESMAEGRGNARFLRLSYHTRIALSVSPLVFSVLGLGIARLRRPIVGQILGVAAIIGYYGLMNFTRFVGTGRASPIAVAWTPNLVAALVISVLFVRRRMSVHRS